MIGFVGLGSMGGAIVTRLLAAGEQVAVFDRSPALLQRFGDAGAHTASSVQEVADRAEVVIACVPDKDASISVASEVMNGTAVRIHADLSTIGCAAIREIEGQLRTKGIQVVDAPISGGRAAIENGTLSVMVAGEETALNRFEQVAKPFAGRITRIGNRVGQAQLCKLVNNGINFTAFLVSCEAVSVGVKAGIKPQVLLDVINAGTGRNSATMDKIPRAIVPRTFDLGGPLGGVVKDLDLFLTEAALAGLPSGVIAHTRKMWSEAITAMDPASDSSNIIRHFENILDVEVSG
ncbi:MAG: NAD(P)-dependent oxidoreductase [Gammaproteobacteria bacterium]|nr:NAD(P)-dependent oxidoreductase [Gammaproteobacteria bacterium]